MEVISSLLVLCNTPFGDYVYLLLTSSRRSLALPRSFDNRSTWLKPHHKQSANSALGHRIHSLQAPENGSQPVLYGRATGPTRLARVAQCSHPQYSARESSSTSKPTQIAGLAFHKRPNRRVDRVATYFRGCTRTWRGPGFASPKASRTFQSHIDVQSPQSAQDDKHAIFNQAEILQGACQKGLEQATRCSKCARC
jgi:hypothetical protein